MTRKSRDGESVCRCSAYTFPHRWGGGECVGISVPDEIWFSSDCRDCHLCHLDDFYCEALVGQEQPWHGDCWREFVRFNEIKVHGRLSLRMCR